MQATTIKFEDGYTVTISPTYQVSYSHKGKSNGCHVSYWKEVPVDSEGADYIRKNGLKIGDYLWSNPTREMVMRAGNGVREAVAAAAQESRVQSAIRKSKLEAPLAAARAGCGLGDPVQVSVGYFAGYQTHVDWNGRELRSVDWTKVSLGQFNFIERSELDRAVEKFDAAAAEKRDREAAAAAVRNREFAAKSEEARTTGKPVLLERWTTDRCMNGHSDECSFDTASRCVMPDGTTKISYTCCY